MNVLIIEDEIKVARELKKLIEQMQNGITVSAILSSVEDALNWFSSNQMPDLILSDIQLADGLSFEIYNQIELKSPVIFCTAYDEYALQAFENNGIDYLLKPIEQNKLKRSFDKLRHLGEALGNKSSDYAQRFGNMLEQMQHDYLYSILVYFRDKIIPVGTDQIDFIQTENNVVYLHSSHQKFEIPEILDNLIDKLNPRDFFRANRQFIIHRKSVGNIEQVFARKLAVTLNTARSEVVIISKAKATSFLKWVEGA